MATQLRVFGRPWPELNEGILYEDVVSSASAGWSLLDYYCSKYNVSAPKEGWLQRIQNGQIKVNGMVVRAPNALIRLGNFVTYHRLPWPEPSAPWQLQVLYEDEYLLALNKPSGLQVLPGGLFQQRTVLTQLRWRSVEPDAGGTNSEGSGRLGPSQPSPVHRLGRGTSGVLLCAKSKAAKAKLSMDIATSTSLEDKHSVSERRVRKKYRALAMGIIRKDEVFINQPIGIVPYPGVSKGLYVALPAGKTSLSKVMVLSRNAKDDCTLVEVEIFTGRPHQIRIHLAYLGHPLVGDPLYVSGGKPAPSTILDYSHGSGLNHDDGGYLKPANAVPGDCGYYLHAHKLIIFHPITGELLEITAPPPPTLCLPGEEAVKLDLN